PIRLSPRLRPLVERWPVMASRRQAAALPSALTASRRLGPPTRTCLSSTQARYFAQRADQLEISQSGRLHLLCFTQIRRYGFVGEHKDHRVEFHYLLFL